MSRTLEELSGHLVGHWKLDGNFKDSSGNDNDGVPTDIEWIPTARGMKPHFNGSNSVINCDGKYLIFGTQMTVSAWINTDESSAGYNAFLSKMRNGGSYEGFELGVAGGKAYFHSGGIYSNSVVGTSIVNDNVWHHLIGVYDGTTSFIFVDGILENSATKDNLIDSTQVISIGRNYDYSLYIHAEVDDINLHTTALISDEVLDLYNSTKETYGVTYVERSFSHNLTPEITDDTIFATDMSTVNSDGTLVDLSGNSNHGTVSGAVRSGGYFRDGMMFDGVDDKISVSGDDLNIVGDITLEALINPNGFTGSPYSDAIVNRLNYAGNVGYQISITNSNGELSTYFGTTRYYQDNAVDLNKTTHIIVSKNGSNLTYCVDGNIIKTFDNVVDIQSNIGDTMFIGAESGHVDGHINFVKLSDVGLHESTAKSRFNALAKLPLYECNFRSMPSNTTVYTDVLPYSSAVINSGSFKLDDGLVCVTDGVVTLRSAHEFDGSEYVYYVNEDGTEVISGGTGGTTYGTVVSSISQGSNIITIDMKAGDTLDNIYIQFREEV